MKNHCVDGTYELLPGQGVETDSGYAFRWAGVHAEPELVSEEVTAVFDVFNAGGEKIETVYLKQGEAYKTRDVELVVAWLDEDSALVEAHSFPPLYPAGGPLGTGTDYLVKGEGVQDKEPDPILFIAAAILIAALLAFYADYSRKRGGWREHGRRQEGWRKKGRWHEE